MIKSFQLKLQHQQQLIQKQREQYDNPEQRNPFVFMEQAIQDARSKIDRMQ
jgi:hypothetical protein